MNTVSVVYFISCKGFIKIGRCRKHNFGKYRTTTNNRIQELQGGNPFELEVLAFIEFPTEDAAKTAEKEIQGFFSDLHHRDEWYSDDAKLQDYIREHATPY